MTHITGTPPMFKLHTAIPTGERATYDAGNSADPKDGLGELVRKNDQKSVGDVAVDAAHDNAGIVYGFYREVLKRNSLDNAGMELLSVAHYDHEYNNAYWDGEKMTYGDGDGENFAPLSKALDVVGHEMTHGMTEHTAALEYYSQPGALNESWSDVFGELIEQWSENKSGFGTTQAAAGADWLIGEDVFTPNTPGDALRSMKAPGTGYDGDPQPGHMNDYVRTRDDNGGVHINSGIPNKAAYIASLAIGSDKLAKIWYSALTDYLRPDSNFSDAVAATISAATKLFSEDQSVSVAIKDAWDAVGVIANMNSDAAKPMSKLERTEIRMQAKPHLHDEGDHGVVPPWLAKGSVASARAATAHLRAA